MSDKLIELSLNESIILNNITCIYCGQELNEDTTSKEHVIGRRFVPKGTFNNHWNLIVRACKSCNAIKSDLEDDISAITMQPNVFGHHSDESETLFKEAERKAKNSYSQFTRKSVSESQENFQIKSSFNKSVNFTFNIISAPQIECNRIYDLARMHIMAFFYFITFNAESKKGGFWKDGFYPIQATQKLDWGNDLQIAFMKTVIKWKPRWFGCTANGFFKSCIRKHPSKNCWSWSVEWNKNYRVIGFFGDMDTAQQEVDDFPDLSFKQISQENNEHYSFREEKQLTEINDIMFAKYENKDC